MNAPLYDESGPEPTVSSKGMALLMGVPLELLQAEFKRQGTNTFRVPAEWLRNGRRRSREYQAATGRTDMRGALEYWADKEGRSLIGSQIRPSRT